MTLDYALLLDRAAHFARAHRDQSLLANIEGAQRRLVEDESTPLTKQMKRVMRRARTPGD